MVETQTNSLGIQKLGGSRGDGVPEWFRSQARSDFLSARKNFSCISLVMCESLRGLKCGSHLCFWMLPWSQWRAESRREVRLVRHLQEGPSRDMTVIGVQLRRPTLMQHFRSEINRASCFHIKDKPKDCLCLNPCPWFPFTQNREPKKKVPLGAGSDCRLRMCWVGCQDSSGRSQKEAQETNLGHHKRKQFPSLVFWAREKEPQVPYFFLSLYSEMASDELAWQSDFVKAVTGNLFGLGCQIELPLMWLSTWLWQLWALF